MKYAILMRSGYIQRVQDTEPTEEELYSGLIFEQISDEDALAYENRTEDLWYINDSLHNKEGYIEIAIKRRVDTKIDEHFSNDLEGAKKLIRNYFSEKRYNVEVGGLDMGGLAVRTDRLTVARIYQANQLATADPTFTTEWKLGDGSFVTVDATLIAQLSAAITAHIQSSFSQEKAVNALIDAATTIDEVKAIEW